MSDLWDNFSHTGSVKAYLAYKAYVDEKLDTERGGRGRHVQGQGLGDKRVPGGRTR